MNATLSGIVLRYADYRDNDRMLTLFTREAGKLAVLSRGCRRSGSPLLSSSQSFAYSELVLFHNKGRYYLNSADLRESFYSISSDVDRFASGSYMVSLIDALMAEGESNETMFTLLYHALSFLSYSDSSPLDLALFFTVRALSIAGYSPSLTHCAICGRDLRMMRKAGFSAANGGAVCDACKGSGLTYVSALSLEAGRRMIHLPDADIQKVVLPQAVREELKSALKGYVEYILDKRIKAFDML